MPEPRIIPWKRIAVEAAAIVVSILLAFAIDAWWDERIERNIEHKTLQALQSDFVASKDQLAEILQWGPDLIRSFARFQSATPNELTKIDPEETLLIVNSLTIAGTFDPVTATLDALSNDGRLGLISDPELLRHLSSWQRAMDDLEANGLELHAEAMRVRRAMEKYGGPFIRYQPNADDIEPLMSADAETLAILRQDDDFMGKARSHQYALGNYLFELGGFVETLDSILILLDQNISQN